MPNLHKSKMATNYILPMSTISMVMNVSSMGRALTFRADGPGSIPGPA